MDNFFSRKRSAERKVFIDRRADIYEHGGVLPSKEPGLGRAEPEIRLASKAGIDKR